MTNPDLVIRGGTIADGSGGDLYEADVAIKDGRITEVGKVSGKGKEEIDAKGKLVAPGFVDVHTHYDGQVTWSQDITPSSQNGVTTAVMGNCGVGFAPCKPADHRPPDPADGRRRGHSRAGAERRHSVVMGKLPRLHGLAVEAQFRHRHRRAAAACGAPRLCDGRARRAARSLHGRGQQGDGGAGERSGARRRARLLDLAHAQSPHLDRRFHADLEGRRGRADRDRGGDARPGPQRAAIRARSLDHPRRPADDAAGRRQHQVPDHLLDHPERQGAAALPPDAGRDQRRRRARAQHHRADRGAPGRPAARARTVAQSVPDPSELQGDRAFAAGRARRSGCTSARCARRS